MEKNDGDLALFMLSCMCLTADKLQWVQCVSISRANSPSILYPCGKSQRAAVPGKVTCFQGWRGGFRTSFALNLPWADWRCWDPVRLCVCVRICAGSDRGAYGRSHSPLTVPLFWQAQACFSQSAHSRSHSCTSLAPCLLAFSSLPGCKSFVVF